VFPKLIFEPPVSGVAPEIEKHERIDRGTRLSAKSLPG
jgi:hypothetical protein